MRCRNCEPYGRDTHKKLYEVWTNIKQRTRNKNCRNYHQYGGRGIDICDEWFNSFTDFVFDLTTLPSYKPGLTLDRIDNSKGYQNGNVRWATMKEQARNRRGNKFLTFNGETKTISAWAEQIGMTDSAIVHRINKLGWPVEKALTQKKRA